MNNDVFYGIFSLAVGIICLYSFKKHKVNPKKDYLNVNLGRVFLGIFGIISGIIIIAKSFND